MVQEQLNTRFWWWVSTCFSLMMITIIGIMWYVSDSDYSPNEHQLISMQSAETALVIKLKESNRYQNANKTFIPTGIFVQSLSFNNSNDVNVTGYIWQKYPVDNALPNPKKQAGFIFPEQVDSGSNISPKLIYEQIDDDEVTYGWYFESTLRQQFDYQKYPLDHKTVWIRIWPYDFDRSHYLLPSLDSYHSTSPGAPFGLDKNIVLGSWDIQETFYDYKVVDYDTNFGLTANGRHQSYPELYFNVVLKRRFLNSFIVEVVPLLTVATLLFSLVMTTSSDHENKEFMGFDVNTIIAVVSALFFAVMLSHIHIREKFAGQGVVYIEYFFLIMYAQMIFIIVNTFIFANSKHINIFTYGNNILVKISFWPLMLFFMVIVTYIFLF